MRPVVALLGVSAALWAAALAGSGLVGDPLGLLVVAAVALWLGLRSPWPRVLLTGCAATTLVAVGDQAVEGARFSLANDGVFYGVVVLAPALVGLALAARRRQVVRLEAERRHLERRRETVLAAVRAEETARVERQVDDVLAARLHDLAAAAGEEGPEALARVESTARTALSELRDVLGVLHENPVPSPPTAAPRPRTPWSWVDGVLLLAGIPIAVETGDVVVSVAQGALLPVVRRRPVTGAVLLLAVACAQTHWLTPLPPTVSWLVPGLLLALLVGATPRRRDALAGLAATLAGVGLMNVLTPAAHRTAFLPEVVLGLLAWGAGRMLAARERRAAELAAIAAELAATEESEARFAAARRRTDLARELHDVGAHALTVVCLQAGAGRTWWDRDPARARQAVDTLRTLVDGPLNALGDSLTRLDDHRLDAEVVTRLGRALELDLEVETRGTPVADASSRTALRVVQEALTNAARHGGGPVRVVLDHRDDELHVTVRDTGAPAGPVLVGAGRGLDGMRHRAETANGALVAGPAGDGFEVDLRLPR